MSVRVRACPLNCMIFLRKTKRPRAIAGDLFHDFGGVADGTGTHDDRNHNPWFNPL